MLEDDPLSGAKTPMAIVVSCARSCGAFGSACTMFDTASGELQMIRTMGNSIGTSGSILGSVELALGLAEAIKELPPVVLVVGNTQNDVVEEAVILAMTAQGRGNACPKPKVSMALRTRAKASDPICPPPTPRMRVLARLRPAPSPLRPVYASAVPPTRSHFLTQSPAPGSESGHHIKINVARPYPRRRTFSKRSHLVSMCCNGGQSSPSSSTH